MHATSRLTERFLSCRRILPSSVIWPYRSRGATTPFPRPQRRRWNRSTTNTYEIRILTGDRDDVDLRRAWRRSGPWCLDARSERTHGVYREDHCDGKRGDPGQSAARLYMASPGSGESARPQRSCRRYGRAMRYRFSVRSRPCVPSLSLRPPPSSPFAPRASRRESRARSRRS